jgi:ribosomal protein L37AE/L43A
MASIAFCPRCRSDQVDVVRWEDPFTSVWRCSECGYEAKSGFTLGRVYGDFGYIAALRAKGDIALPKKAVVFGG